MPSPERVIDRKRYVFSKTFPTVEEAGEYKRRLRNSGRPAIIVTEYKDVPRSNQVKRQISVWIEKR